MPLVAHEPLEDVLAERFADRDTDIVLRLHYPGMRLEDVATAVDRVGREVIPRLAR